MKKLFVFFIGLIIYGSLFPFTFSYNNGAPERWDILFHSFHPFTSLGDILGNIVLFMPFGYLGLEALSTARSGKPPTRKIIFYGLALALIIQLIQVYVPSRSPAFADVYWNGLGIILGIMSAQLIKRFFPKLSLSDATNIPAILALFWLLYLLFPFVPTLDFQEIKNSIKSLVLSPVFHWSNFLIGTTGWLLFAQFTKGLFHQPLLDRQRLLLFGIFSIIIRPIILSNYIFPSDVLAVIAAIVIWPRLERSKVNNIRFLACAIAVTILYYSIGSLDFSSHNFGFSWIPFSGFLEGNLFGNTRSLLFKLFLLSSMIWLVKAGWPYGRFQSLWIFSFILFLETLQIFMSSHTAEITDPLLVLLLAFLIRVKETAPSPQADTAKETKTTIPEKTNPEKTSNPTKQIVLFISSILLITVVMSIVIRLPGVPYNVRELFRFGGSFIAILPFALFILWFGMSIPLISRRMLKQPDYHFIRFPLWVFCAGIISYLLLKISVTEEALDDIVGSSNVFWFVSNQNIWGSFGMMLSKIIPLPSVWAILEEIVRFLALFSPLTFMLCLFYQAGDLIEKYNISGFFNKGRLVMMSLSLNIIYALPWFYLCKFIAFDHSSTDNLNELIARDGFFGTGGGGYLYLLFMLLALNCVWVRQSQWRAFFKVSSIIAAATLGWFLFNLGLEANVQKYGQTFSGVDFLLGPDRKVKLSETYLFLRWIILYTSSITILAWGMRFTIPSLLSPRIKNKTNRRLNNG